MKYVERDGSQGCFSSLWITQKFELLHQLCRVSRQLPCRDMPGLEVQWKTPTVGASNGMSRRPFTGLRSLLSSTVNHVDDSEKSGVHQVRLVGNDLWFVGFLYIQTVLGNGISKPYHFQKLSYLHPLYLSATSTERPICRSFPQRENNSIKVPYQTERRTIWLGSVQGRFQVSIYHQPKQTMHYVSKKSIKIYHTFAACFISPKGVPCNDPVLKMPKTRGFFFGFSLHRIWGLRVTASSVACAVLGASRQDWLAQGNSQYCWWKKSGDHQLRLVVHAIICNMVSRISSIQWFRTLYFFPKPLLLNGPTERYLF